MEEIERIIHVTPDFIEKVCLQSIKNNTSTNIPSLEESNKLDVYCMTGGQKGKLRLWNISSGREINISQSHYSIQGAGLQSRICDLHMTNND